MYIISNALLNRTYLTGRYLINSYIFKENNYSRNIVEVITSVLRRDLPGFNYSL